MKKIPFGDLFIRDRFFDITQDGAEFIKISCTEAKRLSDGKVVEFRRSGNIYTKARSKR